MTYSSSGSHNALNGYSGPGRGRPKSRVAHRRNSGGGRGVSHPRGRNSQDDPAHFPGTGSWLAAATTDEKLQPIASASKVPQAAALFGRPRASAPSQHTTTQRPASQTRDSRSAESSFRIATDGFATVAERPGSRDRLACHAPPIR